MNHEQGIKWLQAAARQGQENAQQVLREQGLTEPTTK